MGCSAGLVQIQHFFHAGEPPIKPNRVFRDRANQILDVLKHDALASQLALEPTHPGVQSSDFAFETVEPAFETVEPFFQTAEPLVERSDETDEEFLVVFAHKKLG